MLDSGGIGAGGGGIRVLDSGAGNGGNGDSGGIGA